MWKGCIKEINPQLVYGVPGAPQDILASCSMKTCLWLSSPHRDGGACSKWSSCEWTAGILLGNCGELMRRESIHSEGLVHVMPGIWGEVWKIRLEQQEFEEIVSYIRQITEST